MKKKFKKEDISDISESILNKISKTKSSKAKVLALSGELGAGKTTLTQELGRILGIKDKIISPTFVIMKIYDIDKKSEYYSSFKKLIHIDAYRLESKEELFKIGWTDLNDDKDNLIIIEWPEKVEGALDDGSHFVKLEHVDEETRVLEF